MSSPPVVGLENELEGEISELLNEIAVQQSAAASARPSLRRPALWRRKGPLLLAPEILEGRPLLQIDYFELDKAAIGKYQAGLITLAARFIAARAKTSNPISAVRLVGHTDSRGSASYNSALGARRANAVRTAMIRALNERIAGLGSRTRFQIQSAGATQPLRRSPSPAGPGLNRRVTVYLTAQQSAATRETLFETATPPALPSIVPRPCCILSSEIPVFGSNIVDPTNLGTHGDPLSEKNGLIYSGKGGFLDLGHIRDMIDVTKFVFDQINAATTFPATVNSAHGEATIPSKLSPEMVLPVARLIANDDGFAYEIMTYWMTGVGTHNSAFSPEDLCSNNLGTLVAERAILAGGNYNTAATNELKTCITSLDPQSPAESRAAFNLIKSCWVNFSTPRDVLSNTYLRRRNLTLLPWKTGHKSDAATPPFVTCCPPSARGLYQYTHTLARTIKDKDFPAEMLAIRSDASVPAKYGPNWDKPRPCP